MTPERRKAIAALLLPRPFSQPASLSPAVAERDLFYMEILQEVMAALDEAENQVAALTRNFGSLKNDHLKLMRELGELQLMAVKDGTVRFGPNASEIADAKKPRGRRWKR